MEKSVFKSTNAMVLASFGIVLNIVAGLVVDLLKIPLLFLDTIGTILVSVILGPWVGAMTGGLTNVISGVLTNPKNIPFALVNIVIALVVGFIAKYNRFNYKVAITTGIILSVVAPLIGTPIAVYVFGGLTGDANDVIFTWLLTSGQRIFTAAFIPRITGNFIDKIISCLVVAFLIQRLDQTPLFKKMINND